MRWDFCPESSRLSQKHPQTHLTFEKTKLSSGLRLTKYFGFETVSNGVKSDSTVCIEMGPLPRVFHIVSEALMDSLDIWRYKTELWIVINKRLWFQKLSKMM
jgi:hypothetical protein